MLDITAIADDSIYLIALIILLHIGEYQLATIGSDLCRNRRFSQSFLCLIPKLNLKKVWKSKVESKPIEDLNAMQSQIMSHMFDNNHEIRFEENQHFNDETSEMIAQSRPTLDDSHYPRQQTSPVTINDFYDISNDFSPLDHKENVDGFEALIEIPMKDRPKTPSAANVLQFREVSGTLKGFQGSDEAGINVKSGDGREVNESKRTIADANAFRDNLGGVIQVVNTFSSHRSVNKVKNVDFLPKVATFSTTPWKPMPPINFQYLHQTNDFTKRPRFPVIHKTTKIPFFTTTSTQSNQRIKDLEAKEQNIRAEKLMKLTENKRIVNRPTIETIRDWSLKMSKSRKNWLPSTDEVIVGSNRLFNTSNTNITNGFKDSITKSIPDYDLDKEKVSFKAIEATKTEKSQVSDVTLATHLGAVNNRESSISKEKPGPEYPTYSSAASSTFRCESLGFFADTSFECQVYHHCGENDYHQKFICPNGTLFNAKIESCDYWYNVDCNGSIQSTDRSQTHPHSPQSVDTFDSKSENSRVIEDIKNYIKNIDKI